MREVGMGNDKVVKAKDMHGFNLSLLGTYESIGAEICLEKEWERDSETYDTLQSLHWFPYCFSEIWATWFVLQIFYFLFSFNPVKNYNHDDIDLMVLKWNRFNMLATKSTTPQNLITSIFFIYFVETPTFYFVHKY